MNGTEYYCSPAIACNDSGTSAQFMLPLLYKASRLRMCFALSSERLQACISESSRPEAGPLPNSPPNCPLPWERRTAPEHSLFISRKSAQTEGSADDLSDHKEVCRISCHGDMSASCAHKKTMQCVQQTVHVVLTTGATRPTTAHWWLTTGAVYQCNLCSDTPLSLISSRVCTLPLQYASL